jgi:hypothetical protein
VDIVQPKIRQRELTNMQHIFRWSMSVSVQRLATDLRQDQVICNGGQPVSASRHW